MYSYMADKNEMNEGLSRAPPPPPGPPAKPPRSRGPSGPRARQLGPLPSSVLLRLVGLPADRPDRIGAASDDSLGPGGVGPAHTRKIMAAAPVATLYSMVGALILATKPVRATDKCMKNAWK